MFGFNKIRNPKNSSLRRLPDLNEAAEAPAARVFVNPKELKELNAKIVEEITAAGTAKKITVQVQPRYAMEFLPQGVIVKRIFPRKSGYQWMVKYHAWKTEHYGTTLDEALAKLFKSRPALLKRYEANVYGGREQ